MARRTSLRPAPGIVVRHGRSCASRDGGSCNCVPTFEAWVWNKTEGRKIRRSFPTLAAAKTWRSDAVPAVRRHELRTPTRLTLDEAAREWLDGARAGSIFSRSQRRYKPSVIRSYETALEKRVLPLLGSVRLSEITRSQLLALKERLLAAGHSASTIRNSFIPLQAIFRRAHSSGLVTINPTLNLDLPAVDGKRDRAATPDEAAELLAPLLEAHKALWATAFYAGLRRGELRALRANDVDLEAGVIRVEHGWDDVDGEIDPKSRKGARTVPIPNVLRGYLATHLLATGRSGDELLFGRTGRDPFTPSYVRKSAAEAWSAANAERESQGLPPLVPIGLHECRHTYVTLMFEAGLPLERIGDYVGHAGSHMTERYRHLMKGHEAEAAAKLDAYLARVDSAARVRQLDS